LLVDLAAQAQQQHVETHGVDTVVEGSDRAGIFSELLSIIM